MIPPNLLLPPSTPDLSSVDLRWPPVDLPSNVVDFPSPVDVNVDLPSPVDLPSHVDKTLNFVWHSIGEEIAMLWLSQSFCWLKITCKTINYTTWMLECNVWWKTFFPLCKNLAFERESLLPEKLPPCSSACCWNPPWPLFPAGSLQSSSASSAHQVSLSSGTFGSSLTESSL